MFFDFFDLFSESDEAVTIFKDLNITINDLYNRFTKFLKTNEYIAASNILGIFESDKFNHLFNKLVEKDNSLMTYLEPENWKEISEWFKENILLHLNFLIEKNDYLNFKKMIILIKFPFEMYSIIQDESIPRGIYFNLQTLTKILQKKGKAEWIISILQKMDLKSKEIFNVIKQTLLDSEQKILEKASETLIYRVIRELDIIAMNEDKICIDTIKLLITTNQFKNIKTFFRELSINCYDYRELFDTLQFIYEYNPKIYKNIFEQIFIDHRKIDDLSIVPIWICILNDDVENNFFFIEHIKEIIKETYTKSILEQIKKLKSSKELDEQTYEQKKECSDGRDGKQWISYVTLNDYLIDSCITLLLSSISSKYTFDLISFIQRYNLKINEILNRLFEILKDYFIIKKEIFYLKLKEPFKSLINSETVSEEDKLLICKKFIIIFYEFNLNDISLMSFYNFISKSITKKNPKTNLFTDTIKFILENINDQIDDYIHLGSKLTTLPKTEAYHFIQMSFWATIILLSKPLDDKLINGIRRFNFYIFSFLNKHKSIEKKSRIFHLNECKTSMLFTLINQFELFTSIFSKKDSINTFISDLMNNMYYYFERKGKIEEEHEKTKIRIEEQKKILSDLSHSIKNMLRSAIIVPLTDMKENQQLKLNDIDNAIKGANLIRAIVNAMNLSYKGSFNDFVYDAIHPSTDSMTIFEIVIKSLKYSISNMFDGVYFSEFMNSYFPTEKKYVETLKKWKSISETENLHDVVDFINRYFMKTNIDISGVESLSIGNSKGSALKIFIMIQEIILNAIKYSCFVPQEERIFEFKIIENEDDITILQKNYYKPNTKTRTTGLGHIVIENFAKLLNADPIITKQNNEYSLTVIFKNFWRIK